MGPQKQHSRTDSQAAGAKAGKKGSASQMKEEFSVRVTPDRLAVLLTCTVPQGDLEKLQWEIQQELASLGVEGEWEYENLAEWLREMAKKNPRLVNVVLCKGTPPVPSVDGKIEWGGDFFRTGFVADEATGAIDYRQYAAQRTVYADQLLARIIPPREGKDGKDVSGKRIPVGKPKRPRILVGRNVRVDEAEDSYYATASGRIHWEPKDRRRYDAGGRLSVDEVYTIHGSVNLETGNISHPGAVVIEKDVEEGATIEAEGDIEVKGLVEPANIKTSGNLTVRGGITGSSDRRIIVGGSVQAKFILDADIEAGEEIAVEREIRHSSLKTRGSVTMPRGRVIGGTIMALTGITVGDAGSYSVSTVLIAGEDYRLERDLEAKEKEIEALEKAQKKIQTTVEPLVPQAKALSAEKRQVVTELLHKAQEIEDSIARLRNEMAEEMKATSEERANQRIHVRNRVYPETTIVIGKEALKVQHEFPGPAVAWVSKGRVELRPSAR